MMRFFPYIAVERGGELHYVLVEGAEDRFLPSLKPVPGSADYARWLTDLEYVETPNPDYDAPLDIELPSPNLVHVLRALGLGFRQAPVSLGAFGELLDRALAPTSPRYPHAHRYLLRLPDFLAAALQYGAT